MNILKLDDLEIYQLALQIGEDVWRIVEKWDRFSKSTVGEQFVDAADSIAANIAEGYGLYFYKDRKNFCYYSRGSLMETKTWAYKSSKRSLLPLDEYNLLIERLRNLHFKLNAYIKKLKKSSDKSSD